MSVILSHPSFFVLGFDFGSPRSNQFNIVSAAISHYSSTYIYKYNKVKKKYQ